MKRKLTILGLCALVALVAMLVFSRGDARKQSAPTTHSLVVTQGGKLTFQRDPAGYATMTVIANQPKPDTNAPAATTTKP